MKKIILLVLAITWSVAANTWSSEQVNYGGHRVVKLPYQVEGQVIAVPIYLSLNAQTYDMPYEKLINAKQPTAQLKAIKSFLRGIKNKSLSGSSDIISDLEYKSSANYKAAVEGYFQINKIFEGAFLKYILSIDNARYFIFVNVNKDDAKWGRKTSQVYYRVRFIEQLDGKYLFSPFPSSLADNLVESWIGKSNPTNREYQLRPLSEYLPTNKKGIYKIELAKGFQIIFDGADLTISSNVLENDERRVIDWYGGIPNKLKAGGDTANNIFLTSMRPELNKKENQAAMEKLFFSQRPIFIINAKPLYVIYTQFYDHELYSGVRQNYVVEMGGGLKLANYMNIRTNEITNMLRNDRLLEMIKLSNSKAGSESIK